VQLPVQLACKWRATSVSAGSCLPISKLHACQRAARLLHGIGNRHRRLHGTSRYSQRCGEGHGGGGIELVSTSQVLSFEIPSEPDHTLACMGRSQGIEINIHFGKVARTKARVCKHSRFPRCVQHVSDIRRRTDARGASQALAKRLNSPWSMGFPSRRPGTRRPPKKNPARGYGRYQSPDTRTAVRKMAAAIVEKSGSAWNVISRLWRIHLCVLPSGRCPSASAPQNTSATLARALVP
jgi:hypothetical protein